MATRLSWRNVDEKPAKNFLCGHCGLHVSSNVGYSQGLYDDGSGQVQSDIYICHNCKRPSYVRSGEQWPGSLFGGDVAGITDHGVEELYNEVRRAYSQNAYTSSVLGCRKLLMHVAVSKGAPAGQTFVAYVEFLAAEGYVTKDAKGWVDLIRQKGNEANHEIVVMTAEDARDLISFVEMLLKLVFEFPSRIPSRSQQA